jgi:hypothetical protein
MTDNSKMNNLSLDTERTESLNLRAGYGVGNEYVAFLRRAKSSPNLQAQRPTQTSIAYGPLEVFHLIMYGGYSMMSVRYACVLGGKAPCDYGVRVNTRSNYRRAPRLSHAHPVTSCLMPASGSVRMISFGS